MKALKITESFKVKLHVLLSSHEASEMILRVDEIIKCAPRYVCVLKCDNKSALWPLLQTPKAYHFPLVLYGMFAKFLINFCLNVQSTSALDSILDRLLKHLAELCRIVETFSGFSIYEIYTVQLDAITFSNLYDFFLIFDIGSPLQWRCTQKYSIGHWSMLSQQQHSRIGNQNDPENF